MNSPETLPQKFSHKKIIIIIGAAVFIAVLAYFAYTALVPRSNPCESLFGQTTTSLHHKIESLKKRWGRLSEA